jgi:peptidoglycan hydrolase CwlO-like protein
MEKELKNRLNKIEEDINIIKVNVQEGFKEAKGSLARLEIKIDETYNAVDGFVKIVTKLEDEFTAMKADIKRVKEVIKEKLGVDLF